LVVGACCCWQQVRAVAWHAGTPAPLTSTRRRWCGGNLPSGGRIGCCKRQQGEQQHHHQGQLQLHQQQPATACCLWHPAGGLAAGVGRRACKGLCCCWWREVSHASAGMISAVGGVLNLDNSQS
jgi:hypothetical protein